MVTSHLCHIAGRRLRLGGDSAGHWGFQLLHRIHQQLGDGINDGSMVLLYMVCHGSHQYTPSHVSIYTSTMDPSWVIVPNFLGDVSVMSLTLFCRYFVLGECLGVQEEGETLGELVRLNMVGSVHFRGVLMVDISTSDGARRMGIGPIAQNPMKLVNGR